MSYMRTVKIIKKGNALYENCRNYKKRNARYVNCQNNEKEIPDMRTVRIRKKKRNTRYENCRNNKKKKCPLWELPK